MALDKEEMGFGRVEAQWLESGPEEWGRLGGAVDDLRVLCLGRMSRPRRWQGPLGKSHSQLRQEVAGGFLGESENTTYGSLCAIGWGRAGGMGAERLDRDSVVWEGEGRRQQRLAGRQVFRS